ncbi:hypothetical protein CPAR01_05901 [Colletotrichum paranaense]|nr:uncharacterized protein CPAR01_05901 [Colletotrichum paranaense]KAK1542514.1 hypothetical protein CPAR01_05901 [Colletotrichum paranaense]
MPVAIESSTITPHSKARSTVYTAPGGPVTVFSVLERSWLSEVSGGFPPFVSMVGCRIGTYPTPPSSPSSPSSNGSLAESVDAEDHLGFLIDGIADPADQVCQTQCPQGMLLFSTAAI